MICAEFLRAAGYACLFCTVIELLIIAVLDTHSMGIFFWSNLCIACLVAGGIHFTFCFCGLGGSSFGGLIRDHSDGYVFSN